MIKRIQFAGARARARAGAGTGTGTGTGTVGPVPTAWRRRVDAALDAPDDVRPVRVTWCASLDDGADAPTHAGVGLEWFADDAHLERFDAWLAGADPDPASASAAASDGDEIDPVILADEHIMRGEEWLEDRWRDGGTRFKHLAIARRAEGLTPAEFSERWRTGAGRVQAAGERPALVIPDDVRGRAYVQNHPRQRSAGEWAYDAVNEVSFEDLEGLRTRVEWFADHVGAGAEPDLISANWFLATTETVLLPRR